jgi:hypothetical protein
MLTKAFTAMVMRVIITTCAIVVAVALAFQTISAELRKDPVAFATVTESRQTWLGELGVFPTLCIIIFLGLLTISVRVVSIQLDQSTRQIREALGALMLRISPAMAGIQSFIPSSA